MIICVSRSKKNLDNNTFNFQDVAFKTRLVHSNSLRKITVEIALRIDGPRMCGCHIRELIISSNSDAHKATLTIPAVL